MVPGTPPPPAPPPPHAAPYPPPYPPPYAPPPYAPYGYPAPYGARPPGDTKAIVSLVLGILSFFLCGLTGIPAIVLGFSARNEMRRVGAPSGSSGVLATFGILTGFFGAFGAMVGVGLIALGIATGVRDDAHRTSSSPAAPGASAAPVPAVPRAAGPLTFGTVRVTDLDPEATETYHQQLESELQRAAAAKQTVLVMTNAKWCTVCREFEESLHDARMQSALANVAIVRVDVEDFDAELKSEGMLESTLPWFYKVDATLRPTDAISAGEWDENVPENMAPVMKAFVNGTLRTRRSASSLGVSL